MFFRWNCFSSFGGMGDYFLEMPDAVVG